MTVYADPDLSVDGDVYCGYHIEGVIHTYTQIKDVIKNNVERDIDLEDLNFDISNLEVCQVCKRLVTIIPEHTSCNINKN